MAIDEVSGSIHGQYGRRFAFCGNRHFVLEEMIRAQLNMVSIAAVSGSHLERWLKAQGRAHQLVASKAEFLAWLSATEFDAFVSNGCPFIIPVGHLHADRLFLNVHPSYLPDLRGADPVPGALLKGRDSGATCHLIDAGIDTGDVISQVLVPYSEDLDATLLYQLSFIAEREVFLAALERNFERSHAQPAHAATVRYTKAIRDLTIDWSSTALDIVRQVRAFSNRSQGARFTVGGREYRCFDAELVENTFLVARRNLFEENRVALLCEDAILVRKGDRFVKLKCVQGDLSLLLAGDVLS